MKPILMAGLLALAPLASLADESPIFATYGTSNGSLPPEFAWDNDVTIHEDGKIEIRHCTGYETEGPGCKTRKGKVTEEDIAAIRAAALASDLAEKPATRSPDPMVGGGGDWGAVFIDGQEYKLLWDTIPEDADRVEAVKAAIRAAIPPKFESFMHPD